MGLIITAWLMLVPLPPLPVPFPVRCFATVSTFELPPPTHTYTRWDTLSPPGSGLVAELRGRKADPMALTVVHAAAGPLLVFGDEAGGHSVTARERQGRVREGLGFRRDHARTLPRQATSPRWTCA